MFTTRFMAVLTGVHFKRLPLLVQNQILILSFITFFFVFQLVHDFVTRYPNMSEHMKLRWDVIKKAIASQLERTQVKEAGTRLLASIFPTCPTRNTDFLISLKQILTSCISRFYELVWHVKLQIIRSY